MQSTLSQLRPASGKSVKVNRASSAQQVKARTAPVCQALRTAVSATPRSGLGAAELAYLKVDELMSLCRAKGVSVPRNPSREDLMQQLVRANVTVNDLSKGQLGDICMKLGLPASGSDDVLRERVAGAIGGSASSNGSSNASNGNGNGNGRFGSYAAATPAASAGAVASGYVTEAMLNSLRVDVLTSLCQSKKVSVPRNATRYDITRSLISARLTMTDLTKGQLVDIALKMGIPVGSDEATLRSKIAAAGGVSASSAPAAAAPAGRFSSPTQSRSASPAARSVSPTRGSGAPVNSSMLSMLKADELTALCKAKRVEVPRAASKEVLISKLSSASVTVDELSKGQVMEIAMKMGIAVTNDVEGMRNQIAGGSSSAPAAGRFSSPAPASRSAAPSPVRSSSPARSASPARAVQGGSSEVLAMLDISELSNLAKSKQIELPRQLSRTELLQSLKSAGVGVNDLSKTQLKDVAYKMGVSSAGDEADLKARIAGGKVPVRAASPAPARVSSPTPSSSSYSSSSSSAGSMKNVLASMKIDELTSLAKVKRVEVGRNVTKDRLIDNLSRSNVSINDLPKGTLAEVARRLGLPTTGSESSLRQAVLSKVDTMSAPVAAGAPTATKAAPSTSTAVATSAAPAAAPKAAVATGMARTPSLPQVPKPVYGTPKPPAAKPAPPTPVAASPTPELGDYSTELKAVAITTAAAFVVTGGMIVWRPETNYSKSVKNLANSLITVKTNKEVEKNVENTVNRALVTAFEESGLESIYDPEIVEQAAESASAESVYTAVKEAVAKDALAPGAAPAPSASADDVPPLEEEVEEKVTSLQDAIQEAVSGAVMGAVEGTVESLSGMDLGDTASEELQTKTEVLLESAIEGAMRGAVIGAREGAGDTDIEQTLREAVQNAANDVFKYSQSMYEQEEQAAAAGMSDPNAAQDAWLWDNVPMVTNIPPECLLYQPESQYNTFDMSPADAWLYSRGNQ